MGKSVRLCYQQGLNTRTFLAAASWWVTSEWHLKRLIFQGGLVFCLGNVCRPVWLTCWGTYQVHGVYSLWKFQSSLTIVTYWITLRFPWHGRPPVYYLIPSLWPFARNTTSVKFTLNVLYGPSHWNWCFFVSGIRITSESYYLAVTECWKEGSSMGKNCYIPLFLINDSYRQPVRQPPFFCSYAPT